MYDDTGSSAIEENGEHQPDTPYLSFDRHFRGWTEGTTGPGGCWVEELI